MHAMGTNALRQYPLLLYFAKPVKQNFDVTLGAGTDESLPQKEYPSHNINVDEANITEFAMHWPGLWNGKGTCSEDMAFRMATVIRRH